MNLTRYEQVVAVMTPGQWYEAKEVAELSGYPRNNISVILGDAFAKRLVERTEARLATEGRPRRWMRR